MATLGKRSGLGRPHNNKEELKTAEYTEGYVPMRRSIFRRVKKYFKADKKLRGHIEKGHKKYAHFKDILD
jgi:hypothetical protein